MQTLPSKIVCVGRSYADHAKELGNAVPDAAILFIKPPSSLGELSQGITWNKNLGSCHYECELVLQLKQPLSQASDPAQALQAIGAVTLGLDLTLRDLQNQLKSKGHPWERAKAFDGACVLGDWVDVSEIKDWQATQFDFYVNDELRQHGDTSLMLFPIAELLLEMSQSFSLQTGDVIMTGTPAGVAALQAGDQLRMVLHGQSQDFVWTTFVQD
ncbi:MAG: fumarylacetoacetate hydrolase family protein [Acinetobacter sp.]|nr:fumarylacetoacetate hydrolase family protein [Acinetobacter sp.]